MGTFCIYTQRQINVFVGPGKTCKIVFSNRSQKCGVVSCLDIFRKPDFFVSQAERAHFRSRNFASTAFVNRFSSLVKAIAFLALMLIHRCINKEGNHCWNMSSQSWILKFTLMCVAKLQKAQERMLRCSWIPAKIRDYCKRDCNFAAENLSSVLWLYLLFLSSTASSMFTCFVLFHPNLVRRQYPKPLLPRFGGYLHGDQSSAHYVLFIAPLRSQW